MTIVILAVIAAFVAAYIFIPQFREVVKGYRTVAVAVATGVVGAIQQADLGSIIAPNKIGYVLLGLAVVMVILRAITTGPMGKA